MKTAFLLCAVLLLVAASSIQSAQAADDDCAPFRELNPRTISGFLKNRSLFVPSN